jgi:hypothetical protein
MRRSEVVNEKQKEFDDWKKAESDKMKASPLVKKYDKLRKDLRKIAKQIESKGFYVCYDDINMSLSMKNYDERDSRTGEFKPAHPLIKAKQDKAKVNVNEFTRGLNEVLAVIWSMEKPFEECIKLIKSKVKSLS